MLQGGRYAPHEHFTEQVHNKKLNATIPACMCMSIHNACMYSYTGQTLQATTCTTVPYNNYLTIYCIICRHNLYCLNKICPYVKLNYIIYLAIAICNCYNYNIIHKFYM